MAITIKTTCEGIDWEQIPRILKQVNMGYHDPGIHKKAFEQSYAVVFIYNRSRLLGFGRAISDGAYQAAIYDCAVHPDFQGKGLGRIIIKALMATLTGFNIILYASPGKEKFYQKYGFRRMKTGMAFFLDPEKKRESGFTE